CGRLLTACRFIPLNWRPCQTRSGYARFARCTRLLRHTARPRLADPGFVLQAAPTHIGDPHVRTPGGAKQSQFARPNRDRTLVGFATADAVLTTAIEVFPIGPLLTA